MQNLSPNTGHAEPTTVGAVLKLATKELTRASPTPRLDAELLVMRVHGLSHAELVTHSVEVLTQEQEQRLHELVMRRKSGEPVAYLTGTREFWSMEFTVSPATLIPRPATETLVEQALACIPEDANWTVADIGTGCGAIALALARERPMCRVIATEHAQDALEVARHNVTQHESSNVELLYGSWLDPLAGRSVDVVISNPPYIRTEDPHLTAGDVRFEPVHALVAGADGLDAIRHIITHAKSCLRSQGWLLLEHGYDQAESVRDLMQQGDYTHISCHQDLAGLDRVSKCRVA